MPRNSFYDGNAGDTIAIDNSAAAAAVSETNAAASESAAAASETAAAVSETNAAASYDSFDDRYLGVKSSGPTLDNDGDALVDGALYFDTTTNAMMVYDLGGTTWNRTTPTTSDQTKINTVSGIAANVTTVAGISANVTTVAGISSDVTTVAGKSTEIGRLGTAAAVADMAILGTADVVSDMNILGTAAIVADMAILGTADVVADLNTLGTADVVADMNTLGTADVVSDMNTLGTADVVADMNTLGTADVVLDMNTLGTADVVSDMNTLGTSANVTAMDTCASNITGINSFADRYRVSTTAPTTSLDEGDLYFNTTDNKMYRYNGTSWAEIVTYTGGTGINISASNVISASSIALTTVQTAASQVLMLALTAQEGDVVVRTDEKKTYVKNSGSAGTMADFTLLETPTDAVTSVDGATGVVTLNHDTLTGFVANEHLDWTTDQGSTNVHAGNYTDTVYDSTAIDAAVALNTAKVTNVTTNLSTTTTATTNTVVSSDGTNAVLPAATTTVAGVQTGADKAKLDGIEAGATGDQTGAEIKAAYEGEADTNEFSDAEQTKLAGIATSANNYTHPANHAISVITGLQTALDGKVDDSQVLTNVPSGALFTDTTYSVGDGGLTQVNFTTADNTKLDGIATSANNYTHPATHSIAEVSGLQAALDAKEALGNAVAMSIALG